MTEIEKLKEENTRLALALASVEPLALAAVAFAASRADIRRTPRTLDAARMALHEAAQRYADLPKAAARKPWVDRQGQAELRAAKGRLQ